MYDALKKGVSTYEVNGDGRKIFKKKIVGSESVKCSSMAPPHTSHKSTMTTVGKKKLAPTIEWL